MMSGIIRNGGGFLFGGGLRDTMVAGEAAVGTAEGFGPIRGVEDTEAEVGVEVGVMAGIREMPQ